MEFNLVGTLTMFKTMEMRPNFSELSRTFEKDRHTIKNMYDGKENKVRKKKPSELDPYIDEIIEVLSHPGTKIKTVYQYFENEKHLPIITTNKSFNHWGQVFGDSVIANAILDRVLHHSKVFQIIGPSYRMKGKEDLFKDD